MSIRGGKEIRNEKNENKKVEIKQTKNMMKYENPKVNMLLYLAAQILAQGAVQALVPDGIWNKVYTAVVAVVGVLVAFTDTTVAEYNARAEAVGGEAVKKWWKF